MDQDAFNRRMLDSLATITHTLNTLTNYDYCLRSLCLALMAQPGLDHQKLVQDYEDNLQRAQEQVPPNRQAREVYEEFAQAIQDRLPPRTPSAD